MEVARLADGNLTGWRDRARDPAIWNDEAALFKVIETAPPPEQSTALLLEIGRNSVAPEKLRITFLKRVRERNPRDFWINAELGHMLIAAGRPEEAVGYSEAALAIRPEVPVVHNNLGSALIRANRSDEAIGHFRQAIALDPEAGATRLNLAVALWNLHRRDEALRELPEALRLNPRSPILLTLSSEALDRDGKHGEALTQIRQALAIDPNFASAQEALSKHLRRQGRDNEACDAWKKALDVAPTDHSAWYGFAELCLYLGREEDYLAARRALLAKFGETKYVYVAERTSRACLLRPASGEELRQAAALAGRVGAINRANAGAPYPFFQFVLGLSEYRQGHLDRAISLMRGEAAGMPSPAPRLVLAMALQQGGRSAEARKSLAEAVLVHDWRKIKVRDQDGWICHILRREAEQMILPCLPAFLEGRYRPSDNDERLALLGICQFADRHVALASLYADAFASDPQLAKNLGAGHRYSAARAAVLAGVGKGKDAGELGEEKRTRWLKQALDWLELEVAACAVKADGGTPAERQMVRQTLTAWREDPDLAVVRGPEIERLPIGDRRDWLALWKKVDDGHPSGDSSPLDLAGHLSSPAVPRRELHRSRADERLGLLDQGGYLQDGQGELGETVDPVGADPGITVPAPADVAGILRDVAPGTDVEPAGMNLSQVFLKHLDLPADVGRQRGAIDRGAGLGADGGVVGREHMGVQLAGAAVGAALILVEQFRLVPQVGVGSELVLQLVGQLGDEFGRGHVGGAVGAPIGDPQKAQLGRVDHRRHAPLGNGRPGAQQLREPCDRRADVQRRAPDSESVTWVVPSLKLTCHGREPGRVANWARLSRTCWYCNSGTVLPWLIVRWRSRPVVQPVVQARARTIKNETTRIGVPACSRTGY